MLPRANRLASQEIKGIIRQGRRISSPFANLYAIPRAPGQSSRFAFIVSKKVHPHASVRHRYQRLLRYCARQLLAQLDKTPYDIVWVAKPNLIAISNSHALYDKLEPHLSSLYDSN